VGTHRDTGERITGIDDVRQSVAEIMRTPLRSRPMRPEFGTDLLGIVDQPMNAAGRALVAGRTVDAIAKFEKRISITKSSITTTAEGEVEVLAEGEVAGAETQVTSAPLAIPAARRLLRPTSYLDRSTIDLASGQWLSKYGDLSFGALPAELGLPAIDPPTITAADGIRFVEPSTLVAFEADSAKPVPGSLRTSWTIGVAYRVDDEATNQAIWAAGAYIADFPLTPGSPYFYDWIRVYQADGAPQIQVDYPTAESTSFAVAPAPADETRLAVTWVWHFPLPDGSGARIGYDSASGPVELVLPPADPETIGLTFDDLACMIAIGGMWSGAIWQAPGLTGQIPFLGVWPRVLTRRERLAMGAEWRRELGV
jgi:phage baseplate assembly protein W